MPDKVKLTNENSCVISIRVLKKDRKRIEWAARRTKQARGVFARIGVLNEVEFIENQ